MFGNDVTIIGVAGRGDVEAMSSFVATTETSSIDHIADVGGSVWGRYGITSQPAFVFINDDGTTETVVSRLGNERLQEKIGGLIAS